MGYESRLYVVEKTRIHGYENEDKVYGEVIAMFDLCKVYDVSDRMRTYEATDAYIYDTDGNTEIVVDLYGDPLKEVPIKDAIEILKDAIDKDRGYRRYEPCLKLLEGFNESEWDDLVVLHYGY